MNLTFRNLGLMVLIRKFGSRREKRMVDWILIVGKEAYPILQEEVKN